MTLYLIINLRFVPSLVDVFIFLALSLYELLYSFVKNRSITEGYFLN